MDFDAIVIGSGFGGAVSACRLAEAGYRVLVLERGRRWDQEQLPAQGPMTLDLEPRGARALERLARPARVPATWRWPQGAAVGGGSLIYANISCEAAQGRLRSGWPHGDHLRRARSRTTRRSARDERAARCPTTSGRAHAADAGSGAKAIGEGGRFRKLELAVTFDREWTYAKRLRQRSAAQQDDSPMRTASSRAPACTSATATSAATSMPGTRST